MVRDNNMEQRMLLKHTHSSQLVGIIFSKDRPLQLDGTLRSFFLHCLDPDEIDLNVLYTTSNSKQERAYRQLAQDYPSVAFIQEKFFKFDLLFHLNKFDYVLFMVDDTIFVHNFHLSQCVYWLNQFSDAIGFSLRLGKNTTYCYTFNSKQRLPDFNLVNSSTLIFDWTRSEHDFKYPIELSSSLYRLQDIQPLLECLEYSNPNTLESAISQYAQLLAARLPRLLTYRQSAAFSAPINKVQTFNDNRVGNYLGYSTAKLLKLYCDGYRLNVAEYSNFSPNSCHQEITLKLVREDPKPLVSIIISCYKQAEFLHESVGSVLDQYFDDWECIIINDGSPDNTSEIAKKLINADPRNRIRLIEQENMGLSSRNTGMRAARGTFILLLDADDMLHPAYLIETVSALEDNPDYAIVYVDEQNFGNTNHVHRKGQASLDALKYANVHDYCSLFHKKVWGTVKGYSPAMYLGGEDWNFWLSASKYGYRSLHLQKPLFHYRNRENTMVSTTLSNMNEVWAHIVFHNPELFSEEEKREALNHLRTSPPENQRKLELVKQKFPLNKLLQYFAQVSSQKEVLRPDTGSKPTSRTKNAFISVIIPTYNRPEQLVRAVKSVLEQTYTDFEAIVVSDCGINVSNLLKAFNDHRIVHICHEKNKGLAATRNTGLRVAKGKYIAYLDDDDEFYPEHIQTLVDKLENSDFKAAYTDGAKCLYEERNGELFLSSKFVEHSSEFDPLRILAQNYIPVLCMMHEKSCLDHVGLFDETMSVHEDWDLWARLSRHFPFLHIKKTTCSYKIILNAKKNMTTSKQIDFVRTMQQIYRKHHDTTKTIPQLINFQHKCLINITKSLYSNRPATNITVGDNFDIYINDTLFL